MKCAICGKEFTGRIYEGKVVTWCSRRCYQKKYYRDNRDKLLIKHREYNKDYYKPHPKVKKEFNKLEYFKAYYKEHKQYYLDYNRKRYEKQKDDEEFIKKNRERSRLYYEKFKRRKDK